MKFVITQIQRSVDCSEWLKAYVHFFLFPFVCYYRTAIYHKSIWRYWNKRVTTTNGVLHKRGTRTFYLLLYFCSCACSADTWKESMQLCKGHISLLPGSGDDGGVIAHPTASTICSFCRVFHEVKHRGHPSMYLPRNTLQWTLVTTTTFVPKDVAIKMNLLLYRILNEQIDM